MMSKTNSNMMLSAIYDGTLLGSQLAIRYGVSEARISQIKLNLRCLKYKPERDEHGSLVCHVCESATDLVFRKHRKTGEVLALICSTCNKDWEDPPVNDQVAPIENSTIIQERELLRKMIPQFVKAGIKMKLSPGEIQLVKKIYLEVKNHGRV
jgi:hypothetical protein